MMLLDEKIMFIVSSCVLNTKAWLVPPLPMCHCSYLRGEFLYILYILL